jgi:predicted transposase YbfD/YdcC
VDPEDATLTGCWQFIAVRRERQELQDGQLVKQSREYSFYVTSLDHDQASARQLVHHIRDHWAACENGSHYRRDVSLGEDASKISGRKAAQAMATLRNLVVGLFELQKDKEKANATHLPGWQRKMTASAALKLIKNGA